MINNIKECVKKFLFVYPVQCSFKTRLTLIYNYLSIDIHDKPIRFHFIDAIIVVLEVKKNLSYY